MNREEASNRKFETLDLEIRVPVSYCLEKNEQSNRALLVLHGFSDNGRAARKRLLGMDSVPGFSVFVPNGIYPSPVKVGDEYKEAYAWYFRDPRTGTQLVAPETAADSLWRLIERLKLSKKLWTILGFSQGGFFAPYLVRHGLNAKTIIAVGSAYRPEAYEGLSPVKVHAIHGEQDEDVPFEVARKSFDGIYDKGYGDSFTALPGVGHRLDDSGRAIIRRLLAEEASG